MTKAQSNVAITFVNSQTGAKANELGMRTMQEKSFSKLGEQNLLIKSPPASGKGRTPTFIARDKLNERGIRHQGEWFLDPLQ
jgi:hypothetical protein